MAAFTKGVSGNPGGRGKGYDRVAREEADRWAAERGITGEHAGMRAAMRVAFERINAPDIEERDRREYLKFVVERFAGKPRETIDIDTKPELTDDEYAAECDAIARERIAAMTMEERLKLLADPMATETVQ